MNRFDSDLHFLLKYDKNLVLLKNSDGNAQLLISPRYQGKVFTSTATGPSGRSIGYINYKAFETEFPDPHINVYGGENRFWIGPEGGMFSPFFASEVKQVFENWHTPAAIDTGAWNVAHTNSSVTKLEKHTFLYNALGRSFEAMLHRTVRLLPPDDMVTLLGLIPGKSIDYVGYETCNGMTNLNDFRWNSETGTFCIWILDMFTPSPESLTIIPYRNENQEEEFVKTDYFGRIPDNRIKYSDGNIYLKTDGCYRSKIGLRPAHCKSLAANYDAAIGKLSVIFFESDTAASYLNQQWGTDGNLYEGDVLNAYNDGPLKDGSIMGPFYELESSSPAAFLQSGETMIHRHTVIHLFGNDDDLSPFTLKLFGVTPKRLATVFK
jgi:hypothetical protein